MGEYSLEDNSRGTAKLKDKIFVYNDVDKLA